MAWLAEVTRGVRSVTAMLPSVEAREDDLRRRELAFFVLTRYGSPEARDFALSYSAPEGLPAEFVAEGSFAAALDELIARAISG